MFIQNINIPLRYNHKPKDMEKNTHTNITIAWVLGLAFFVALGTDTGDLGYFFMAFLCGLFALDPMKEEEKTTQEKEADNEQLEK